MNQTSISCSLWILFLVNTKIEDAIGKLSSSSSSPKWKRSPDDKVKKAKITLTVVSDLRIFLCKKTTSLPGEKH